MTYNLRAHKTLYKIRIGNTLVEFYDASKVKDG